MVLDLFDIRMRGRVGVCTEEGKGDHSRDNMHHGHSLRSIDRPIVTRFRSPFRNALEGGSRSSRENGDCGVMSGGSRTRGLRK